MKTLESFVECEVSVQSQDKNDKLENDKSAGKIEFRETKFCKSCVRHLARSCELGWELGQKTLLNDHSICGRVESAGKKG